MQIYFPFTYRNGNKMTTCEHCRHVQTETKSINTDMFIKASNYLDNFKVGFEQSYFEQKYEICENCGNIAEALFEDNFKYYNQNTNSIMRNKSISITEKCLLIMYEIRPNEQTLLDLYWYYDINGRKEVKKYREMLIQHYKQKCKQNKDIEYLRMLIELYRRDSQFEVALNTIRKISLNKKKKIHNVEDQMYNEEIRKILFEKELCECKNSSRHIC